MAIIGQVLVEVFLEFRDLLREQVNLPRSGIEGSPESDVEALLFGAGAVIGKIEAFFHQGVDVGQLMLARTLPRVQQHVLDY